MDAVILCGGLGKRLRTVSGETPKVMMDLEGDPFLNLIIKHLASQGINHIILCTGYKADEVERYYRQTDLGVVVDFSREDSPLGTGGAVKNSIPLIETDLFFILNGDSFCPVDLKSLSAFHLQHQARVSVAVSEVKASKDFGGVVIGAKGEVQAFLEKDEKNPQKYVNAGVYCFSREMLNNMPNKKVFSLEYDFFPQLIGKGLYAQVTNKKFFDIGTPQRYNEAVNLLRKGR